MARGKFSMIGPLGLSDVCSAFRPLTAGSKVVDDAKLLAALSVAIATAKFKDGKTFVELDKNAYSYVLPGDAPLPTDVRDEDLVARVWRGKPSAFLRRQPGQVTTFLGAAIQERAAYLLDPDVIADADYMAQVVTSPAKHVIVAIVASCGPDGPIAPAGFVHNLAGGDRTYATMTANEIRDRAKAIDSYYSKYAVVAD